MADLPTNYLDDILAQSMNGKRKFRITRPDGTFEEVIIEDVSEYSQTGSTFGAGDINRTNQAVNEKFDSGDVVDPMLTTEPGFAADAYKTKLQFDEQNKNIVNYIDATYNLNSLTWKTSANGKHYCEDIVVENVSLILGVSIIGFRAIRDSDAIIPIISNDGNKVRFISNVKSFADDTANISVRILYK